MEKLKEFIVKAKKNGWVGSEKEGEKIPSTRLGSLDIIFEEEDFHYHDSFVGFSDFCGMEHITCKNEPVWSMSYYGYLLKPDDFTGNDAVKILEKALGQMYEENRFLGGFYFNEENYEYRDMNYGDWKRFHGIEKVYKNNQLVYELMYFGGTVRK